MLNEHIPEDHVILRRISDDSFDEFTDSWVEELDCKVKEKKNAEMKDSKPLLEVSALGR